MLVGLRTNYLKARYFLNTCVLGAVIEVKDPVLPLQQSS